MAADADARHQNAFLDRAEAVHAHVRHSTLPEMVLPDTMQPGEITESSAWPQRLPCSAKTNFAGGACG